MSNEEVPVESDQVTGEQAPEMPTPDIVSQSSDAQPTSPAGREPAPPRGLTEDRVQALIDQAVRKVQSEKDRRWQAIENEIGSVREVQEAVADIRRLMDAGMNQEGAEAQAILNLVNRQLESQRAAAAQSVPGRTQGSDDLAVAQRRILRQFGIAENDPQLAEFVRGKTWNSHAIYLAELSAFAQARSGQAKPQPSASVVAQPSGTGGRTGTDVDDLSAAFEREKKQIRRGDIGGLHKLQTKYRRLGLPDERM